MGKLSGRQTRLGGHEIWCLEEQPELTKLCFALLRPKQKPIRRNAKVKLR